jgi:hypothetical protein
MEIYGSDTRGGSSTKEASYSIDGSRNSNSEPPLVTKIRGSLFCSDHGYKYD